MSLLDTMPARTLTLRVQARWQLAMISPVAFVRYFVRTLDTHDKIQPVKRFPWRRPHIVPLIRLWQFNPLLSIRKSRQMLITWLFAALSLWDALHPGRLVMVQSKRLEDAVGNEWTGDGPLGRAKFILSHIPAAVGLVEGRHYCKQSILVTFPRWNSGLWAIPQGQDIIRQRTASGIWSDESHFQKEFGDAYTASAPCIRGGGWFVSTSTANPGAALALHEDRLDV